MLNKSSDLSGSVLQRQGRCSKPLGNGNTQRMGASVRAWLVLVLTLLCAFNLAHAQQPGATFDHMSTGFELRGAHQTVRCETCHIDGIFKGTPKECATCHVQNNQRGALAKSVKHIPVTAACESCHAPTSPSFSGVRFSHIMVQEGTCQSCHDGFHGSGKPTNHIPTGMTCGACHNTTAFLPAIKFDHASVSSFANFPCASCHDNLRAKGMSFNHLPNTGKLGCDSCHQASMTSGFTSFGGGQMSHSGISSGCEACHGPNVTNSTFYGVNRIVVMPSTSGPGVNSHLPTTTKCESCHLASTPKAMMPAAAVKGTGPGTGFMTPPPTSAAIHVGASGNCAACHETNFVWMSMSQYPMTGYLGFQTRPQPTAGQFNSADASHPLTGECSTCHAGLSFDPKDVIKPPNHIPTAVSATCSSCHTNTDFSVMPTLADIHANAPST
ncbi:MAG: hypothetical protein WCH35_12230, partial [Comamonadaceae bacterium]